ncbi:leucine-rich repeat-containing protein 51-like [Oreochromis aureus]|uniref:Leucine-rich repeat-containing protein 51 n=1 Tax=Oreochromis aureus TaxID=47969 RepID=A0A668RUC3_OREAU|nr:leucine-rich repeat-containing protein 51-like [Oreochromis aureus]XP_039472739.1 leucine-rich repeat-containing protein 51-like [Oreochromis aureus]XP_039472740.1 leucine-rich repeat-containing protein 51-like [Oreochromis aureus]XP_039472741.1 leucine-rich repeat-containing protein 51-like [Oreochromis aureus]XP_039472742.1 leucine-rich repeat-containing protein 51-like [Oreochromis aureus]
MYGPPVDLSFKNLSNVAGALGELPRSLLRPLTTNSKGKYLSCSLRLSNNSLTDLVGLQYTINHFFAQPSKLGWLDLSFNKITCIEPVLCELKELRVLYLHGNSIWNLSEVDKLRELQHLHTITLHGNLIETSKGYRNYVISVLPQLKKMDFSGVTRDERVMADIWRSHGTKKTPRSLSVSAE